MYQTQHDATTIWGRALLFLFYRYRNWGSERLNKLPKATWLENGGTWIRTQAAGHQSFWPPQQAVDVFPRSFLYLSPRQVVRLKKEVAIAITWTPFQVIWSSVCSSFARGDACLETLLNTCPWREPAAPELFREFLDTWYNEQVWMLL